jgi:hypothetical protein
MEIIFAFAGLVAFAAAALRWGFDSGERIDSEEQNLAAYGMRWDN